MIIEFFILWLCWTCGLANSLVIKATSSASQFVSINEGIREFKDLLYGGLVFVDKSLFIKDVLEHTNKSTLILCPGKWGKSINLDMLKTFLEIEVDLDGNEILPKESTKNYKLFRNGEMVFSNGQVQQLPSPFLIAEHKSILEHHQGKYPVVYIDFEDTKSESYFTILNGIKFVISRAFQQHKYLAKVFEKMHSTDTLKNQSQTFQNILHNKKDFTTDNLLESVEFLCKLLHRHFGKAAYVMLENYDAPLHGVLGWKGLPEEDIDLTLRFIQNFMGRSFVDNQFLNKSLITGTFQLDQPAFQPHWTQFSVHSYVQNPDPLLKHFAFQHKEVQELLQLYNIADQLPSAKRWFNGYKASTQDIGFYNPVSVLTFLPQKKLGFKMASDISSSFLQNLLEFSFTLREQTLHLINRNPVPIDVDWMRFNTKTLTIMNNLIHNDTTKLFCDIVHATDGTSDFNNRIFQITNAFLLGIGFLTPIRHVDGGSNYVQAQVPNHQIDLDLINKLIHVFRRKYHIQNKHFRDGVFDFKFILLDRNTTNNLNDSLNVIYNRLPPFDILVDSYDHVFGSKNPIRMVQHLLLLKMQALSNFSREIIFPNESTTDAIFYDYKEHQGAAVFTTFNLKSTDQALSNAKLNKKILLDKFPNIKRIKYVGINVLVNKTVQLIGSMDENWPPT